MEGGVDGVGICVSLLSVAQLVADTRGEWLEVLVCLPLEGPSLDIA
jgi:hypothetical protein